MLCATVSFYALLAFCIRRFVSLVTSSKTNQRRKKRGGGIQRLKKTIKRCILFKFTTSASDLRFDYWCFFDNGEPYRSITLYGYARPIIQCFFIPEQLTWGPCKKTSGCNLSRLLARHLLVRHREAIKPRLSILSLSQSPPRLHFVAVIFSTLSQPFLLPSSSFSHICQAQLYSSITFASSHTLCLALSRVTFTPPPPPPPPPPPTLLCFMAKSCYSARLQPDSSL